MAVTDLARYRRQFLEARYAFDDLARFVSDLLRNVVVPLAVAIFLFVVGVVVVGHVYRRFVPPPPRQRHEEIKILYRKGYSERAVAQWERDLPEYPPAMLSRACHEIYVEGNPEAGMAALSALRDATEKPGGNGTAISTARRREMSRWTKQIQSMESDALAIGNGNVRMVDMNARLAKLEHLGVSTPS